MQGEEARLEAAAEDLARVLAAFREDGTRTSLSAWQSLYAGILKAFENSLLALNDRPVNYQPLIEIIAVNFRQCVEDELSKNHSTAVESRRFSISILSFSYLYERLTHIANVRTLLPTDRGTLNALSKWLLLKPSTTAHTIAFETIPQDYTVDFFVLTWLSLLTLVPFKIKDEITTILSDFGLSKIRCHGRVRDAAVLLLVSLTIRSPQKATPLLWQLREDDPISFLKAVASVLQQSKVCDLALGAERIDDLVKGTEASEAGIIDLYKMEISGELILQNRNDSPSEISALVKLCMRLMRDNLSGEKRRRSARMMARMISSGRILGADILHEFCSFIEDGMASDSFVASLAYLASDLLKLDATESQPDAMNRLAGLFLQRLCVDPGRPAVPFVVVDAISLFFWTLSRRTLTVQDDRFAIVIQIFLRHAMLDENGQSRRAATAVIQETIGRGLVGDGGQATALIPYVSFETEDRSSQWQRCIKRMAGHPFALECLVTATYETLVDVPLTLNRALDVSAQFTELLRLGTLDRSLHRNITFQVARKLAGDELLPEWSSRQLSLALLSVVCAAGDDPKISRIIQSCLRLALSRLVKKGPPSCSERIITIQDCGGFVEIQILLRLYLALGAQARSFQDSSTKALITRVIAAHKCTHVRICMMELKLLSRFIGNEVEDETLILKEITRRWTKLEDAADRILKKSLLSLSTETCLALETAGAASRQEWTSSILRLIEKGARKPTLVAALVNLTDLAMLVAGSSDDSELRRILVLLALHPTFIIRENALRHLKNLDAGPGDDLKSSDAKERCLSRLQIDWFIRLRARGRSDAACRSCQDIIDFCAKTNESILMIDYSSARFAVPETVPISESLQAIEKVPRLWLQMALLNTAGSSDPAGSREARAIIWSDLIANEKEWRSSVTSFDEKDLPSDWTSLGFKWLQSIFNRLEMKEGAPRIAAGLEAETPLEFRSAIASRLLTIDVSI